MHLETSAGRKALVYRADVAGSTLSGDDYIVGLDGKAGDFNEGRWVRLERDLAADAAAAWPAATVTRVTGIRLVAVDDDLKMDGLSFSNALTVQRNVLAPGAVGHIVQSRDTDTATWAETARHPHYDQVGTVTGWSDAAGAGFAASHSDAWGNAMASWTTGRWAPAGGWLHNTKETDADLGLVYMYQRWYDPAMGTFASAAPFRPEIEHPYGFADASPQLLTDPSGEFFGVGIIAGAFTGAVLGATVGIVVGAVTAALVCSGDSSCICQALVGITVGGAIAGGIAGGVVGAMPDPVGVALMPWAPGAVLVGEKLGGLAGTIGGAAAAESICACKN